MGITDFTYEYKITFHNNIYKAKTLMKFKNRKIRLSTTDMYILLVLMCSALLTAYIWMWYEMKLESMEADINKIF